MLGNRIVPSKLRIIVFVLLLSLVLGGCQDIRSPQVVKVGLIAPFEGPSRPLGYDTLNGVKLRIHQWNESGQEPKIELVALNDDSDPELVAKLPAQLAQDPDIRIILGPPQGHTAMAALTELQNLDVPVLLLAPVRNVPADGLILPYAGIAAHYQKLFQPMLGILPPAWSLPVEQPSIWFGDPLTLAELYRESPELVPAAGPVAGEDAIQGWAPDLTWAIPWAAPMPDNLPESFADDFEALAGEPPSYAAALAYAAADEAIRLIMAAEDYHPNNEALKQVKIPPIGIVNAHLIQ